MNQRPQAKNRIRTRDNAIHKTNTRDKTRIKIIFINQDKTTTRDKTGTGTKP